MSNYSMKYFDTLRAGFKGENEENRKEKIQELRKKYNLLGNPNYQVDPRHLNIKKFSKS